MVSVAARRTNGSVQAKVDARDSHRMFGRHPSVEWTVQAVRRARHRLIPDRRVGEGGDELRPQASVRPARRSPRPRRSGLGMYEPGTQLTFDVREDLTVARGPKQAGQVRNLVQLLFACRGASSLQGGADHGHWSFWSRSWSLPQLLLSSTGVIDFGWTQNRPSTYWHLAGHCGLGDA